jgi:hypothetical protein
MCSAAQARRKAAPMALGQHSYRKSRGFFNMFVIAIGPPSVFAQWISEFAKTQRRVCVAFQPQSFGDISKSDRRLFQVCKESEAQTAYLLGS